MVVCLYMSALWWTVDWSLPSPSWRPSRDNGWMEASLSAQSSRCGPDANSTPMSHLISHFEDIFMSLYRQYSGRLLPFLNLCGFGLQWITFLHDLTVHSIIDLTIHCSKVQSSVPTSSLWPWLPPHSQRLISPFLLHCLRISLLVWLLTSTMSDPNEEEPLIKKDSTAGGNDLNNTDPKEINEDVAKVQRIF